MNRRILTIVLLALVIASGVSYLVYRLVQVRMLGAGALDQRAELVRPACTSPVRDRRDHRKTATGTEHAPDLCQRSASVKPVEGVRHGHRGHGRVG